MKTKRYYGLFTKRDGKWVRLFAAISLTKESAIRTFQDALIFGVNGERCELRPI